MRKIRVGIVGFGSAGKGFHFNDLINRSEYEVVCVQTTNKERTEYINNYYPVVKVVTTFDELLSMDIDLVVIATANNAHFSYTEQALLNNKHVVCEKPFVETLEKASYLFDLAKRKGLVLRVFHNRRYDGDFLTIKALINQNTFTDIFTASFRYDRLKEGPFDNWRFKKDVMAGLFYDLGPHVVHHARELFGLPNQVYLELFSERTEDNVDDHFELTLYYKDKVCRIGGHTFSRENQPKMMVVSRDKTYLKYGFDKPDSNYNRSNTGYQNREPGLLIDNEGTKEVLLYYGKHYMFYDYVYQDITNGDAHPEFIDYALDVINIMEKAIESFEKQQRINL